MKLKCFVVDDELTSIGIICRYINSTEGLELIGYETDEKEAMRKLIEKEIVPDILFLDIMMPNINGIDFAQKITAKFPIIFITGNIDFALPAFKYGLAYLVKPLIRADFSEAIEKVKQWYEGKNPQLQIKDDILIIKDGTKGSFIHIKLEDLLFVESDANYMRMTMHDGTVQLAYTSLIALEKRLAGLLFCRVHKKFIVNLKFIDSIWSNNIRLSGNFIIPIGQKYREYFTEEVIKKMLPE